MAEPVDVDEVEEKVEEVLKANLEEKLSEIASDRNDGKTPTSIKDWVTVSHRRPNSFPAVLVSVAEKAFVEEPRVYGQRCTIQVDTLVSEEIDGEVEAMRVGEGVESVLESYSTLEGLVPAGEVQGTSRWLNPGFPSPPVFGARTSFRVYLEEAPEVVQPLFYIDSQGKVALHPDITFKEVDGIASGAALQLTDNTLEITGQLFEGRRGAGSGIWGVDRGGNMYINTVKENQDQDAVFFIDTTNNGTLSLRGELQVLQSLASDRLMEAYSQTGNVLIEGIEKTSQYNFVSMLRDSGDLEVSWLCELEVT